MYKSRALLQGGFEQCIDRAQGFIELKLRLTERLKFRQCDQPCCMNMQIPGWLATRQKKSTNGIAYHLEVQACRCHFLCTLPDDLNRIVFGPHCNTFKCKASCLCGR